MKLMCKRLKIVTWNMILDQREVIVNHFFFDFSQPASTSISARDARNEAEGVR